MESARRDEQDMVGLERAIFGRDRRALDQRQQVALHAFAADRSATHIADRNLVDLVQENDAILLGAGDGDARDIILVQTLVLLFLDQLVPGIGDAQLAALLLILAQRLGHHVGQVDHADLAAHAGNIHRHRRAVGDFHLDLDIVHLVLFDPLAEGQAGRFARFLARKRVEQTVHRRLRRRFAHGFAATVLLQPYRFLDQVADDLFDVPADIADLGELGRLDLHERRIGQLRKTTADLGLAAPRRPDHQDVFGRHLVAQIVGQMLPPPAIAQRDSDSALGILLADNMRVKRRDDGFGGQIVVHLYVDLFFSSPAFAGEATET